ncbi:hypothetical protein [Nocardioides sp.]|uniref:hypothetical protein n=1 Tax=Nocardioides sp. TaxID=35761 RepID=UPI0027358598|nr:hypothetical protein [Nocardioides sp.]MDP3892400.1 hypothetical protein [Nocardioides sp.]
MNQHKNRRGLVAGAAGLLALVLVATTAPVAANHLVVRTSDLVKGAVTTPKIAKGAVKPGKIAKGAVRSGKIADGAVTRSKMSTDLQPLWAMVWGGPSISRGRGAVSVEESGANWILKLTFDRDVSACSYTATPSAPTAGNPEQVGMISLRPFTGEPSALLVTTRDHTGAPDPLGFTVHVLC